MEINSSSNPYPYEKRIISSFLTDYLTIINRRDIIEEYELHPFEINVLDKRQTLVEKLVSLIRFSFEDDVVKSISSKIRHFYDLYYLVNENECLEYLQSSDFQKDMSEMFIHDQHEFDIPMGWQTKMVNESPLYNNFPALWSTLSQVYQRELSPLVFAEIPDQKLIAKSFMKILEEIKK